jgi:hypothetical protein
MLSAELAAVSVLQEDPVEVLQRSNGDGEWDRQVG